MTNKSMRKNSSMTKNIKHIEIHGHQSDLKTGGVVSPKNSTDGGASTGLRV